MTPLQALEEAKKRYPNGTRYISAVTPFKYIIGSNPKIFRREHKSGHFVILEDTNFAAVYQSRTDQWAEVIQPEKSLEERLVEEYGFYKHSNGAGFKLKLKQIRIFIIPDLDGSTKVEVWLEDALICTNPNNLEAFIKAYLDLF